MTLAFSTEWPKNMGELAGRKTHFMVKVLKVLDQPLDEHIRNAIFSQYWSTKVFDEVSGKKHSIREDKSDRWRAGRNIHFVIKNRTPDRLQFAPVVQCVSTQKITISYNSLSPEWPNVFVDSNLLSPGEVRNLARNDGFESVADFNRYFEGSFTGKIIHWTDLKY